MPRARTSNGTAAVLRPTIVAHEENADLRKVWHTATFLHRVARQHSLTEGQAVLYVNVLADRARLVMILYGMPVLVLPPTDPERRLSLFLTVSEYLRKFHPTATVRRSLNEEIGRAAARLLSQRARQRRIRREAKAAAAGEGV